MTLRLTPKEAAKVCIAGIEKDVNGILARPMTEGRDVRATKDISEDAQDGPDNFNTAWSRQKHVSHSSNEKNPRGLGTAFSFCSSDFVISDKYPSSLDFFLKAF